MRPLAALALIGMLGCAARPRIGPPETERELIARHERARLSRSLSVAGLVGGVIIGAIGIGLMAHGGAVRQQENSDDGDGLGAMLGGLFATGAGFALALGSGIKLGTSTVEIRETQQALDQRR